MTPHIHKNIPDSSGMNAFTVDTALQAPARFPVASARTDASGRAGVTPADGG